MADIAFMKVQNASCLLLHTGLQNDHKDVMKQIEVKLHELHAYSSEDAAPMEVNGEHHAVNFVAFARIDHVDEGSPASSAVIAPYKCLYYYYLL